MPNSYILTSDGGFVKRDELYHAVWKGTQKKDHKYINRYWKNGRWNYEYYNPDAEKKQQVYRDSLNSAAKSSARMLNAEGDMRRLKYTSADPTNANDLINNTKKRAKVRSEWNDHRKALQAHSKDVDKAIKEIKKEKISNLPQKIISKGIVAVGNFLSNLFGFGGKRTKVKASKH